MNQLTLLRKLTGEQRLKQAFALSDFTLELVRKNIEDGFSKKIPVKETAEKLKQRLKP